MSDILEFFLPLVNLVVAFLLIFFFAVKSDVKEKKGENQENGFF